ncbi:MAG: hypothetical protein IPK16_31885 [Anaerolineales bacterium]|nr:hypothetical protein [Anaerolineales bacterium]
MEWDSEGVGAPSVLYDANAKLWKMWYAGLSLYGGGYQIGYATSPDGITWTKHANNPIFVASTSGWDDLNVLSPNVIYRNGQYHMWYAGRGDRLQIGYATSPDGINWTKSAKNPVLPFGGDLDWDNGEIASPSVLWMGDHYEMWYQGYNRVVQRTFIGHAYSPDGATWTKYDVNPVMGGQPLTWDAFSVYYPAVVQAGDQLMMWFHGEPSALEKNRSVLRSGTRMRSRR